MGSVEVDKKKLKFSELKAELVRRRELFQDKEFPAGPSSATPETANDIEWKRPQDITDDPKFIVEGVHRLDLNQGNINNCWFVAAAAGLAASEKKLLEYCVPHDQDFNRNYAGIFLFRFWNFGDWVEVFVDDLLPCKRGTRDLMYVRNESQKNEFWAPLFEKAYAKLHGGYGNLDGGFSSDALVDFTGGISEFVDVKSRRNNPGDLFEMLKSMSKMSSLIGTHINAPTAKELPNGLFSGHAYMVTKIEQLEGTNHRLLRLMNPWGKGEFIGAWSDGSSEWMSIPPNLKTKLELETKDDGEFWMSFEDWLKNFETLTICHLYPDAIAEEICKCQGKHLWQTESFQAEWIRGVSDGGGRQSNRFFWTNPQHVISVEPADCGPDGIRHVVISLMQKAQGNKWTLEISFAICRLRDDAPVLPMGVNYGPEAVATSDVGQSMLRREVSSHCQLSPGRYLIIPFTRQSGTEGTFLLRVYMEVQRDQF